MKLREVWVVAGTDNAGIWQAFVKQGVETRLAGIVERGGGLIHEQPLGFLKQRARKRDALLFSSRETCSQFCSSSNRQHGSLLRSTCPRFGVPLMNSIPKT